MSGSIQEILDEYEQSGSTGHAELDEALGLYETGAYEPAQIAEALRQGGLDVAADVFVQRWAADEQVMAEPLSASEYLEQRQARAQAVQQLAADAATAKAETEAAQKAAEHSQMVDDTVSEWWKTHPLADRLGPTMAQVGQALADQQGRPLAPSSPEDVRRHLDHQAAAAAELERARLRAEAEWDLGEHIAARSDGWLGNSKRPLRDSDGRQFNATTGRYENFGDAFARHVDDSRAVPSTPLAQQAGDELDRELNDPARVQFQLDTERALSHGTEGGSGERPKTIDGKTLDLPKPPPRNAEADPTFDPDGRRAVLENEWKV